MTKNRINFFLMLIASAIIATIFFGCVYGFEILDFSNVQWMRNAPNDMVAHYIGWIFYKNTPWQFPIGLLGGMIQDGMFSVVYTDSIPLFALIFKLLAPLFPDRFQYFGFFSLTTYILQAILGCYLVYSITGKRIESVIASGFFVSSSVMLYKMFLHTSLVFHPIILMAMILYFEKPNNVWEKGDVIKWSLLLSLAVSVHAYFFPIVLAFEFFYFLREYPLKKWYWMVGKLTFSGIVTGIVMCVWGYFYGEHSTQEFGLGTYGASLNSMLDSAGVSILDKLWKNDVQISNVSEWFAYLGLGVIFMFLFIAVDYLRKKQTVNIKKQHYFLIALGLVFYVVSVIPCIKMGRTELFWIPLPNGLYKIMSIFRANARFIWPIMYLIMLGGCVYIIKFYPKKGKYILLVFLLIQLIDLFPLFSLKSSMREYLCKTEEKQLSEYDIPDKDEIFFMYEPNYEGDFHTTMALGKYAIDKNISLDDFYTSRKNGEKMERMRQEEKKKLNEGRPDKNKIYVFDKSSMIGYLLNDGLNIYNLDGRLIGITDKIKNAEPLEMNKGVDLFANTNFVTSCGDPIYHDHKEIEKMHMMVLLSGDLLYDTFEIPKGQYLIQIKGDDLSGCMPYAESEGVEMVSVKSEKNEIDIIINISNVSANLEFYLIKSGENSSYIDEWKMFSI